MSELVMGLDGAGGGWVGVVLRDGAFQNARFGTLGVLLDWAGTVGTIGVDIPIGNLPWGGRLADTAARKLLGRARASSVFSAPPLEALRLGEYDEANRQLGQLGRRKLSKQSWALRPKVLEIDELAGRDARVIECHPEVSFHAMAGGPLEVGKKTWQGLARRRRLLAENGIVLPDELPDVGQAAPDDVVDAAACAWSAFRFDSGFAVALPEDVETDLNGRRIAIWY